MALVHEPFTQTSSPRRALSITSRPTSEPRHVKVTGNVPPSATSRARTSAARSRRRHRQLLRASACPNCGFGGTNVTMMQLVGGTEVHARCTCGHTWMPGQKPVYVVTRAETVECTCPDVCERDHSNE